MLEISHSGVSLRIDETDGGRAVSWRVGERELLGSKSEHPIDYGMYPMAPWAGRIRGNEVTFAGQSHPLPVNFDPWAIHGLVLSEAFEVIEQSVDRVVLQREFGPHWPVRGRLRCTWALDAEGLSTELHCSAFAGEFPAVVGWHPWFARVVDDVAAAWSTDCTELLLKGVDSLPTGERRAFDSQAGSFDDVITGGRHATIAWPSTLAIEIENSHPWFVVYDAPQRFICIEPQTGPADGLSDRHASITYVTPDHPLVMSTRWRITRERQAG